MGEKTKETFEGVGRTCFLTIAYDSLPEEYKGTPKYTCNAISDKIMAATNTVVNGCLVSVSVTAKEYMHVHAVISAKPGRLPAYKKAVGLDIDYIEWLKGTKEQAIDYVLRRGDYADDDEIVLDYVTSGKIKEPLKAKNLEEAIELFELGFTLNEILISNPKLFNRHKVLSKCIDLHMNKKEGGKREVHVVWHIVTPGPSEDTIIDGLSDPFVIEQANNNDWIDEYDVQNTLVLAGYSRENKLRLCDFKAATSKRKMPFLSFKANRYPHWNKVEIISTSAPSEIYWDMTDLTSVVYIIDEIVVHYRFVARNNREVEREYMVNKNDYYDSALNLWRKAFNSDKSFLKAKENGYGLVFDKNKYIFLFEKNGGEIDVLGKKIKI